ncbi:MAG TPA: hypothetical protein VHO25_19540, partial [Polyangiaceae bacterium]|nr:hypothetical protein [Polyangiaceae bacterium]
QGWVNELLDGQRPKGSPSRTRGVYACETPSHCAYFATREPHLREKFYIYEVETSGPFHKAPMAVVNRITNMGREHLGIHEAVQEYWAPSHKWSYIEVIAEEYIVAAQVAAPHDEDLIAAQLHYGDDTDMAKRLFTNSE